jgi:hypothetical protein
MAGKAALLSKVVPAAEILRAVEALPEFLTRRGYRQCSVMHGWGSAQPVESLWKPTDIVVQALPEFVASALARKDFVAGDSDLYVEVVEPAAQFLFCHESDIHLQCEDVELRAAFRGFLEKLGIAVSYAST